MKTYLGAAALAMTLYAPLASAASGDVMGTIGVRALDSDDWEPVDSQVMLGVVADFAIANAPVYIQVALRGSADESDEGNFRVTGSYGDLSAGVKFMPQTGVVRPYAGAGISSLFGRFEIEQRSCQSSPCAIDFDGDKVGFYVGGGVLWRIGRHFDLGVDVNYIAGGDFEFDDEGDGPSANHLAIGALIGYGWGSVAAEEPRQPPRRAPRRR